MEAAMARIDYTDFHQFAPAAVAALMALGQAVGIPDWRRTSSSW
jgi:hypothetical protein